MSTTIVKKQNNTSQYIKKVQPALSNLCVDENHFVPKAGTGACKKCSCQKFVPETNRTASSITSHQAYPCANCGHDVRMHA